MKVAPFHAHDKHVDAWLYVHFDADDIFLHFDLLISLQKILIQKYLLILGAGHDDQAIFAFVAVQSTDGLADFPSLHQVVAEKVDGVEVARVATEVQIVIGVVAL